MSRPVSEYFVLALLSVALIYCLYFVPTMLWKAIRTGRIPGRCVTYDRLMQPFGFWFCVSLWIFVLTLLLASEALLIMTFWRGQ